MTISPTHIGATILLNKLRLIGLFDLLLLLKSFVFDSIHEDLEMGVYITIILQLFCVCVCVVCVFVSAGLKSESVHVITYLLTAVVCVCCVVVVVCVCIMGVYMIELFAVSAARVTVVFV